MAYKKYIQRNGKLYGPYTYQSKRVDGKVVSEYYGNKEIVKENKVKVLEVFNNKNFKRVLFIIGGIALLVLLIHLLTFSNVNNVSGKAVLMVETSYEDGQPLNGVLRFSLKEGEFLPADSKLVLENNNQVYEFTLKDVLKDSYSNGDYYVDGFDIQGNGQGYGIEGEKEVYPQVNFVLQVYNEVNEEVENDSPIEEPPEADDSTSITGNSVRSYGGFFASFFGLTGMISMELENEIEGVVSKDNPFIYNLKEGESVELKPKSVSIDGEEVDDGTISLSIEEGEAIVQTEYLEIEEGYGEEYLGEKQKVLSLDLSDLNLLLNKGDLNIGLVYEDTQILELTTLLEEGEKSSEEAIRDVEEDFVEEESTDDNEEVIQEPIDEIEEIIQEPLVEENETVEEVVDSSIWDIGNFLTAEERKILSDEFGNILLKNVKSEIFNGRIIMEYEFDEYSVEYSYDSSLNKDVLEVEMEKDRIKFLKDIASSISKEESISKPLEGYNETYAP